MLCCCCFFFRRGRRRSVKCAEADKQWELELLYSVWWVSKPVHIKNQVHARHTSAQNSTCEHFFCAGQDWGGEVANFWFSFALYNNGGVNNDHTFEKNRMVCSLSALTLPYMPPSWTDYFLRFTDHGNSTSCYRFTLYCLFNYVEQCNISRWFPYCVLYWCMCVFLS